MIVSIHARTRGCERPESTLYIYTVHFLFQSTLAPEGASDDTEREIGLIKTSFNPRSHPRVRATHCLGVSMDRPPSFNPRSHPRVRATRPGPRKRPHLSFQSTLAPEGASDRWHWHINDVATRFQSTLAPEGASDNLNPCALPLATCFNPRSHPRVRATSGFGEQS